MMSLSNMSVYEPESTLLADDGQPTLVSGQVSTFSYKVYSPNFFFKF